MKKKLIKKQIGGAASDSTSYYKDQQKLYSDIAKIHAQYGAKKAAQEAMSKSEKARQDAVRQQFKNKPGFDKLGNQIKKKAGGTIKSKKK